jgi:CrcB protein
MTRIFWIAVAGALGTLARYGASGAALRIFGPSFPYGTLVVNAVGSFVLAAVVYAGVVKNVLSPDLRLALGVGFCGGFTTYSTFNYETMRYLQERAWLLAAGNVVLTLVICMVAGFLGWWGASLVLGK